MKALALAFGVFASVSASAQTPAADPTGHWKGTIEVPGMPAEFEVDIARDLSRGLVGTITVVGEHVTLPLLKIEIDGRRLTIYPRTDQVIRGELAAGDTTISGTAAIQGYELPFAMTRTGDATIAPPPVNRAVSKDLEGAWKGVLSAGSRELHLLLVIENRPDGTSFARHVSVDEGGLTVYVAVTQDGRTVRVDGPALSTSFTGELNAAGTAIAGRWSQRQITLPLTLTRATVEGQR